MLQVYVFRSEKVRGCTDAKWLRLKSIVYKNFNVMMNINTNNVHWERTSPSLTSYSRYMLLFKLIQYYIGRDEIIFLKYEFIQSSIPSTWIYDTRTKTCSYSLWYFFALHNLVYFMIEIRRELYTVNNVVLYTRHCNYCSLLHYLHYYYIVYNMLLGTDNSTV